MKILLYHMRYHPDATGTAPLVTQLAEDLVSYGNQVTVIASLPHYGRNSYHEDYQQYKGTYLKRLENGVKVVRTPVFVPTYNAFFPRILNYLSYAFNSVFAGLRSDPVDVVLAINPPITTTFSAWIISILKKAPLVVGIQDVWPDCIILVGKLNNRLLIWFSKILERIQYRIVRKVIVLSEGMKDNLIAKNVAPEKVEVIANWADTGAVRPLVKDNNFSRKHNLKDQFVVLFSGNLGYISALETVISAAALLRENQEILFILAGEGSVKRDLMDQAGILGLHNVKFLPTQPKQTWLEMLAACDLALVTLRRDLANLNVPSKVYTLMAAAKPILAGVPPESAVAELVSSANSGIICKPEDPVSMAEHILMVMLQPDLLEEYGKNGRDYLLRNLRRQGQTMNYNRVLEKAAS